MTHHHNSSEKHSNALLSGAQILPRRVRPNMTVAELIDEQFQAYNGARLNEAARVYAERMLDPEQDVTIGLTMAGALTPAGLGGCVLTLMEYGFVDFIISTGANLYHDMHHALAMSLHRGDFRLDDVKLQEEGVIRIYDILFEDQVLLDTDSFVRESLRSLPNRPISTSELHHHLGQQLLKAGVKPEYSVLAQAAAWNVPIYTSSPGDSSIGMNVARNALDGSQLTLDPLADVNETTAIVHHATRNGVIILGGGSPKNFYLQTQPQLWEVLGIQKGGHDYFIQVTADAPHWGGLSGATPSEAVSWGKIKPGQLNDAVVVYGDSTIALPLLTSYAVSKAQPRPRRELFARRQELLSELKEAYESGKEARP
ncbi:homospermidine biosynthesis protein [Dictyobacter aurantiacus]|uniref:Deoxyhypusine synthase n=1 Tax=Dictyobacter aurantiacus TaxID=1936993 RepID=A0A401Z9M9_9CHLR|nr:deoxyhypusine synthase [Dictyobacter aurantiacus]GCE03581.1 deoxyhypusine synthase [Dictyobacter aurantiacus]